MKFKISFILFILIFSSNKVNNSDSTENYYYFNLVDEEMKTGNYISPTISEDGYLYIVTGNNEDLKANLSQRYIIIYDINSASFVKKIVYNTSFGFYSGEAYAFLDKSQYLFISSFNGTLGSGSYAIRDIRGEGSIWGDSSICGYNRFFKKAGNYFYFIHLDCENDSIFIKKLEIAYYKNYIPRFEIINTNNEVKIYHEPITDAIISCDLTNDNNYIICAYYPKEYNISVSVFDNNLKLLLTEKLGIALDIKANYFIKIAYFKENSNFILMNCPNNLITRLYYFKYTYNKLTDKLSSIIGKSQNYLDIENTQDIGYDNRNDFIIADSNKIIKIFIKSNRNILIITIIQFYDNDSYMSIKIYNMINDNGFSQFQYSKISLLKQSFVICSSAIKNTRRPGYFFINYPNSTDIILNKNNIVINDLIKLENKLFSIELKFKILNIPHDFKLISKSNSLEVNNNDEFELNDELILRQYRVNEGPFILKYQSIAKGTDSGYLDSKVYPPEKVIVNEELTFEGRHGQITFDFKNCLSGYYNFEDDKNLCSNTKHIGYYFDKENQIFRACPSNCEDCNAPDSAHTNCLSCKNNFYLTEDTKACYAKDVERYYFDSTNQILKPCHKNCLKCYGEPVSETNMSCYKCPENFYKVESYDLCYDYIPNNYYLDGNILRKCYESCMNCLGPKNSETMNCLGCKSDEYFYKNDTYECIKPEEFKKRENLEFTRLSNGNFVIFIIIFVVAIIIFICNCKFYKIKKEQEPKKENEKKESQEKENLLKKNNGSQNIELQKIEKK